MTRACIVMTTVANDEDAERIARTVLDARLAACVQIQAITSLYRWKGEIARDPERLLFCKTVEANYEGLRDAILSVHPYETPEIVRVPIDASLDRYLGWLEAETT